MDNRDAKKKLLAAQKLLGQTDSLEKLMAVMMLLKGVHPRLDEMLHVTEARASELEKVLGGDFLGLVLEKMPETTEEEKRRKKLLAGFWRTWNDLKSEVARVQTEMDATQQNTDTTSKIWDFSRFISAAKGAFGIVTVVAVLAALGLQATSAEVVIVNQGCGTMIPSSSMRIPLPGLTFPTQPIESGGNGVARVPALTYTVDGTQTGSITAKALGFSLTFNLGGVLDVLLDGDSLLGKISTLNARASKNHTLAFICKR